MVLLRDLEMPLAAILAPAPAYELSVAARAPLLFGAGVLPFAPLIDERLDDDGGSVAEFWEKRRPQPVIPFTVLNALPATLLANLAATTGAALTALKPLLSVP